MDSLDFDSLITNEPSIFVYQFKLSFLDEEVSRQESKFVTKFYRKPTFSGVYTHFDSFLPTVFKFDMVFTLACQSFNFSSHWTKFLEELNFLKGVFFNNEYFLS